MCLQRNMPFSRAGTGLISANRSGDWNFQTEHRTDMSGIFSDLMEVAGTSDAVQIKTSLPLSFLQCPRKKGGAAD